MIGIFYELIAEASIGKINIDDCDFDVSFNTEIYQNDKLVWKHRNENIYPILSIRNEEKFYNLLAKYLKLEIQKNRKVSRFCKDKNKNHLKWLMMYLFINATDEDFTNPENLLRRRIDFLEDKTFDYLENEMSVAAGKILNNSTLKIKKTTSHTAMETPYKIQLSLTKKEDDIEVEYKLPSIYYGISNGCCYIYAIKKEKDETQREFSRLTTKQDKLNEYMKEIEHLLANSHYSFIDKMFYTDKQKKVEKELNSVNEKLKKQIITKKYQNQINRILYKINKDVDKDLLVGNSPLDYESNIGDVTHSFVLALSIFVSLLQNNHIEQIKVVPYLPIRYYHRDIMADKKKEQEDRIVAKINNDELQYNLTNKLIRTFRRLAYHNNDLTITSYPNEVDEYLTLKVNPKTTDLNNDLLKEVNENIIEGDNNEGPKTI